MSTVSDLIRDARDRAGLTQAELAAMLGVNQRDVSRWERGIHQPRAEMLDRLLAQCDEITFDHKGKNHANSA